MKCFVIAMRGEAEPILRAMKNIVEKSKNLYEGEMCGEKTAVVVSGVGKVNAAGATQFAIDLYSPSAVINTGVAGGLNARVEIGKIYSVERAVQYDFDLTQLNGTPMGTLDGYSEPYLPLASVENYPKRRLATGDRFNDDKADYKLLTEVLKADIRDMEGGAVAQICINNNVPCYSFKAISDIAGRGSTTEQFRQNLQLCYAELEREAENIFKSV